MAKKALSENPHEVRDDAAVMRAMLMAITDLRNAVKIVAGAACPFADNLLNNADMSIAQAKELLGE